MSTSFSANQYENAFYSQKLQNWTVPKHFKERPSAAEGYTTFIATDRGHLLPGVRTKENINEDQPAEESKMYASNPEKNESEVVTEKPNFQHNQAKSRTTSSTGQQTQLKPVNLAQSNQPLSTAKLS